MTRKIKETEIESTLNVHHAQSEKLDAFISDELFAHAYNASDGNMYVTSPDYSVDAADDVEYLPKTIGALTIKGSDDSSAIITQSGDTLTIDKKLSIQDGVADSDAVAMGQLADFGAGDMLKSVYDTDDSGRVDNADYDSSNDPASTDDNMQDALTAHGQALETVADGITIHVNDEDNPHNTTAAHVGLGDVDNTSDADKPISDAQAAVNVINNSEHTTFGNSIQANTDSIVALEGATMKVSEQGGTFPTSEQTFNFNIITTSDNTDLLDANATTNIVAFKKPLRYSLITHVSVETTGGGDKTLTLRVRNSADDSLLNERDILIDGGRNVPQSFTDTTLFDNPTDDLDVYFTAQCTDTEVDLIELSLTIATGTGGSSGGLWDTDNGNLVNVGQRPLDINVPTAGSGDLVITGTGTAYDSTYSATGNLDGFGNETLTDGTNTAIKDNTNNYWCLMNGVTTTNPPFNTTQYCNFTGSEEGVYTIILGSGSSGLGTIAAGGAGVPAIVANSDIVAPVMEITGKASRRYDSEGSYIVDTIIEPETGAAYVIVANGKARFAIPVGGSGNATQAYRSMLLGGYTVGSEDANNDTNVGNTFFDDTFIDCNTGSDANPAKPDMGIGGALQVVDKVLIGADSASGDRVIVQDGKVTSSDGTNTVELDTDHLYVNQSITPLNTPMVIGEGSGGESAFFEGGIKTGQSGSENTSACYADPSHFPSYETVVSAIADKHAMIRINKQGTGSGAEYQKFCTITRNGAYGNYDATLSVSGRAGQQFFITIGVNADDIQFKTGVARLYGTQDSRGVTLVVTVDADEVNVYLKPNYDWDDHYGSVISEAFGSSISTITFYETPVNSGTTQPTGTEDTKTATFVSII